MITSLIGAIAALVGLLLFSNSKKKSAEALLENAATKDQLNKLDQTVSKNTGLLDSEEIKRKEIEDAIKKQQAGPVIDSDLLAFLNKPKS